ncbi:dihydrodipicolinate reductase [Candidatus Photodesmus katoptron]|uniref:4-hydroxy-tetrahydrodipicolinate reductase n=1 Tax=Candidatus Photodesmus katoptron Akat1 TaxID=1236703 RepID=S3EHQ0_9GAMM|nr:4-hydroxy-tetrahydrodipicolinate reductase [Candidatus Photodesmus katoptron]EPE37713.1 dihydrodipicolinate reductase [Candidatus Photodesmus katoptron Akat1]KEY90565.1 dihydrodipicolinate reductase [Candidatus Photodesmus katoptron]
MVKIGISGIMGRMGSCVVKSALNHRDIMVNAAFESANSSSIGMDIGKLFGEKNIGVILTNNFEESAEKFEILIDFTTPESTLKNIELCKKYKKKIVIGTTGFSDKERFLINEAAQEIAVMISPNYSVGINLLFKLLEISSKVIGNFCDIEIIEAHHRHKVDMPSGTAIAMRDIIVDAMRENSKDDVFHQMSKNKISFSVIRASNLVGEHTAIFFGTGERVELVHKATDRMMFANGAIAAALWLSDKSSGLFSMTDVLGL